MPARARATARGTLVVTAGQLALAAAGFVAALLLARELGPVSYGVWGIVYAVLAGVEQIGRLGIPQATSRLVAEAGGADPVLERRAVTLTGLVFAGLFAGLWLAAPALGQLLAIPDGSRLLRIAALDVLPFGLFSVLLAIVNGRRDFAVEGLANLVYAGTRILGLLLVAPFGLTIEAALIVTVLSSLAACLALIPRLGFGVLRPRPDGFRPILAVAAPVAVAWGAAGVLGNLDLWALGAFGAAVEGEVKGWYTAALNLARLPNLLAFVATSILVPTIARALGAGDRSAALAGLATGSRLMLIVLLPVGSIGAAEARGLLELLFSPAFADGAPFLALLLVGHGVLLTGFVALGSVLVAAGRERVGALLAPAGAGLGLVLLPVGTVLGGAIGTALGSLLTALAACASAAWVVRRLVGPLLEPGVAPRALLATGVVTGLVLAIPSHGLWLVAELGSAGVVYMGLLVATGLLGRGELEVLRIGPAASRGR